MEALTRHLSALGWAFRYLLTATSRRHPGLTHFKVIQDLLQISGQGRKLQSSRRQSAIAVPDASWSEICQCSHSERDHSTNTSSSSGFHRLLIMFIPSFIISFWIVGLANQDPFRGYQRIWIPSVDSVISATDPALASPWRWVGVRLPVATPRLVTISQVSSSGHGSKPQMWGHDLLSQAEWATAGCLAKPNPSKIEHARSVFAADTSWGWWCRTYQFAVLTQNQPTDKQTMHACILTYVHIHACCIHAYGHTGIHICMQKNMVMHT